MWRGSGSPSTLIGWVSAGTRMTAKRPTEFWKNEALSSYQVFGNLPLRMTHDTLPVQYRNDCGWSGVKGDNETIRDKGLLLRWQVVVIKRHYTINTVCQWWDGVQFKHELWSYFWFANSQSERQEEVAGLTCSGMQRRAQSLSHKDRMIHRWRIDS